MKACYFECHNTRSGDIASDFLQSSPLLFLMSDVYSGYGKAVKACNKKRKKAGLLPLLSLFCNAHARRRFVESLDIAPEAKFFILQYKRIYTLEKSMTGLGKRRKKNIRKKVRSILKRMKKRAEKAKLMYSDKSTFGKACNYFIKNFKGLSLFTTNVDLPIDNNHAERLLRSPVIGRKTWYGTHSKQGAETAAILFSIIQSCKLNKINPREYLKEVVQRLHYNKAGPTPFEYSQEKL